MRRRRTAGSLNRMSQFKLDIFEPDQLQLDKYVYRWVRDEPGRIRGATQSDDYDFVPACDIKNFNAEATDSESVERIRQLAGRDKDDNPVYDYLLRKPREYWEADQNEMVAFREAQMAGRVYNAESTEDNDTELDENFYVPPEAQLGHTGERKRGPISRRPYKKRAS